MGDSQGNARSTTVAVCTTSIENYSIAHVLYILDALLLVFSDSWDIKLQGKHSLQR